MAAAAAAEGVEGEVRRDMWGQEYRTASADCAAALDDYYGQTMAFGRHRGRAVLRAADADPSCALASALAAHFVAPRDHARAADFLAAAADSLDKATEYERAVFRALSALVGEEKDVEVAIERHFELLKEFPRDLMSLKRAQLICFYVGRPDTSLNFVQQVLPENQDQNFIYGMLAFPLLELGRMEEAEVAARKGLAINKNDFWSQHNKFVIRLLGGTHRYYIERELMYIPGVVSSMNLIYPATWMCHVFQQECRFKEATEFMESCSPSWTACSSFMLTHNWWHVAVCYLEGESPIRKVLDVYDQNIMKELDRSDSEAAEVYLNALGLLLRLYVRGEIGPAKERLTTLLDELKNESIWHAEWLLDLLILWALSSMNEIKAAENLLNSLRSRVSSMEAKRQQVMHKAIQLADAVSKYGKGEHKTVFDILGRDFDGLSYKMIGASDEQVDVFNEVWYTVLINVGETSTAIEVLDKQISKREGAPFLWRLLEKAYSVEGRGVDASVASEKANALQAAYFH